MQSDMVAIAERERGSGFTGLAGSRLDVAVPVTQRLVDVLVAHMAAQRSLRGLTVTLRADREIGIAVVKPVFGFETRLAVDLRIRGPVDLATDPRLYLIVARPSLTWSAISRLVIAAGLAPAGVEIGRDGVAIDLRMLASRAGIEDLLPLVRTIAFDGDPGMLGVHVTVDVPEGGLPQKGAPGTRPGDRVTGSPRESPAPRFMETLLPEMRGTRVRGRLAIGQDLANEALGIALAAARQADPVPAAGTAGRPPAALRRPIQAAAVARWVQRATVRFEEGRIVLEPDVVIG